MSSPHPRERPPAGGPEVNQNQTVRSIVTPNSSSRHVQISTAAITYAEQGWPVFPLKGKSPLKGSHAFHDATTDLDQITKWWAQDTTYNIGTSIPDTMVVVDVDAKNGGLATLAQLQKTRGIPDTLTVNTGGGGLHFYFLHPGGPVRQGAAILGDGIDTRVPGKGFVVLPPSVHKSGQPYEWYDETVPPAVMPPWMVFKLRPPKPRTFKWKGHTAYDSIDSRMQGVLSVVTSDGPGWSDRLYWAACRAGEMTAEGADPNNLIRLLIEAAQPWNERETRAALGTIRSGIYRTGGVE